LIGFGFVASVRRPESRSSVLMSATGFTWFLGNFAGAGVSVMAWAAAHAHASAEADADDRTRLLLEQALAEVQAGLGELRELAHGIYPAILTEAGLGPALATLADSAPIPVELDNAVPRRYPEAIETAAYLLVTDAIEDAAGRGAGYAAVTVAHRDGRLTVTVEDDGQGRTSPMAEIADRVGALDGILTVEPTWMGAQIPCG
jgi:signal transduction histidine kinase